LVLVEPPGVPGFPGYSERARAVAAAGAAVVIGILPDEIDWPTVAEAGRRAETALLLEPAPRIVGTMTVGEVASLVRASGGDLAAILNGQPGPSFRAVPLNLRASFDVSSLVRRIASNNVAGRIRGTGGGRETVLLLGHWDHLGLCRPEGAEDRICNGAVDNASGIAVLLEVARGLAAGPKPKRDILFLATTAEEMGLLGATHFAAHPTVPLTSIVAAMNLDTVAISPKGEKVAVIGGGMPALDAVLAQTISAMGRVRDTDKEADPFITRQDGWALTRAGVPAIMVGGSFSDMKALEGFLSGPYHKPEDDLSRPLVLEGAAEDADLHIALGRKLADPAAYPTPAAGARP
jgi:hypothetical protein